MKNFLRIIAFILLLCSSNKPSLNAAAPNPALQQMMQDLMADMARQQAIAAQQRIDRGNRTAQLHGDLARAEAAGDVGRAAELRSRIQQRDSAQNFENQADQMMLGLGGQLAGGMVSAFNNNINRENQLALDANRIRNEGFMKMKLLERMTDPKTLTAVSLAIVGIVGGYFALKVTADQVQKRLGIPPLVDETSRMGIWGNIKAIFSAKDQEAVKPTEEVILEPEIAEKMTTLAEDTKQTNELKLPYQNILLEGPPGTGKTAFAKLLAYYSGMDYAILSGSRFAQFDSKQALIELYKIIDWAENNSRGTMLFIDEADACFKARNGKFATQENINFVNGWISKTGSSSDKVMWIFATNYPQELDSAVLSRIHKKMRFNLPTLMGREQILQLKIDKYIANDSRTYVKDNKTVTESLIIASDVTSNYLHNLAIKMDNFSGRDIEYAVLEMRLRAYRSGSCSLTKEIMEKVINEKIASVAQGREIEAYQTGKQSAVNSKK